MADRSHRSRVAQPESAASQPAPGRASRTSKLAPATNSGVQRRTADRAPSPAATTSSTSSSSSSSCEESWNALFDVLAPAPAQRSPPPTVQRSAHAHGAHHGDDSASFVALVRSGMISLDVIASWTREHLDRRAEVLAAVRTALGEDAATKLDSEVPRATHARRERQDHEHGVVRLDDLHYRFWGFEVDDATVRAEFGDGLDALAAAVKPDPRATITVIGHTSTSGSEGHNVPLSIERANNVRAALQRRHVVFQKIVPLGVGETAPLVDEAGGPSAMARNRRAEVRIVHGPRQDPDVAMSSGDLAQVLATDYPKPDKYMPGCDDSEMYLRLARAKLVVWTNYISKGMGPTGTPIRGLDSNAMQPDLAEWRMAYLSERVPEKVGRKAYDDVKLSPGHDINAEISSLRAEIGRYEKMLAHSGEQCDESVRLGSWFTDDGPTPTLAVPGVRDAKGHYY